MPFPIPPLNGTEGSPTSTNAQVLIGNVQPDGTISKFVNNGTYNDYQITNRYEKDGHIYMMGLTSPGGNPTTGTCAFVQTAIPTLLWISDWTACKWTDQPEIPNPVPYKDNWVLLDEHIETAMMTIGPDGNTPIYRCTGTYVYGNKYPRAYLVSDITYGRPPYIDDSIPRDMPTSKLTPNLINNFGNG